MKPSAASGSASTPAPSPPRIGITSETGVQIDEYEAAVRAAGGEPVRLVPQPERVDDALRDLDGIVFSGGEDVDPAWYDAVPHPHTEPATRERDAFELPLIRAAFARRLPTLAICRGIQVANVAFGGTLHQHVPDTYGAAIAHQPQVDGATFRGLIDAHRVAVSDGSALAALVGPSVVTGSRHHQALDRVAEAFRVVGRAPDGVVEAIEPLAPAPFWLGVQWHPESTVTLDGGASAALFAALIGAARVRVS